MVRDDQVVLIDKYTGRGRPDTRYHFGLQAAVEIKEGVPVQPEHEVLGQISVQGFISQYSTVCGMTGTAMSSQEGVSEHLWPGRYLRGPQQGTLNARISSPGCTLASETNWKPCWRRSDSAN
ncbi:MAG: hypothetical protein Ct9H300mP11_06410 [Chloroflexota bacterium]|nr:MAG: hypothetical protein Ct9H300mP11_06410 [Chloroflexota bacterium]